jgi:hypothetical protein
MNGLGDPGSCYALQLECSISFEVRNISNHDWAEEHELCSRTKHSYSLHDLPRILISSWYRSVSTAACPLFFTLRIYSLGLGFPLYGRMAWQRGEHIGEDCVVDIAAWWRRLFHEDDGMFCGWLGFVDGLVS